jgi:hypothetical protein
LRPGIALLLVIAADGLLWPKAAFADPAGVRFLDESALQVSQEKGETQSLELVLLNGTGQATNISLYFVAAAREDGSSFPITPPPGGDKRLATSPEVEIGGQWTTGVTLGSIEAVPGTYSGQFVALASDGSVARRDIRLTIDEAQATAGSASPSPKVGDVLVEPLPAITLGTERTSWPWADGEPARAVTIASAAELFDRLIPGALVSESGELATVTVGANGEILVVAAGPGAYKGLLGRPKEGTETSPAKLTDVTLNVRDDLGWPIAVLMFGLALAAFIEWAATDFFPKGALRRRLSELEHRAKSTADEHGTEILALGPKWLGGDNLDFRIHGVDAQARKAVLSDAIEIGLRDFDDTPAADKRLEKWGSRGNEFAALRTLVESYEKAVSRRREIQSAFGEIRATVPVQLRDQLDDSGLRDAIRDALSGQTPISIDAWNAVTDRIAKVHEAATRAKQLASFLARLDDLIPIDSENQSAIDRLWMRLCNLDVGTFSELDQLEKDAVALRNKVAQALLEREAARAVDQPGLAYVMFGPTDVFADFVPTLRRLLDALRLEATTSEPASPVAPILPTPEEIKSSLRGWNLIFLAIVAISVVIVGLSTQYATKLNFGSPQDYLILLAWGFVGTGALQLVRNFVSGAGFLRG